MPLKLDYFYGNQAEQYSFYRIPKALFTDSRYKGVSVEAKVLYGLLLDRMSLSARNEWFDSSRRVYIYFTLEDALSQIGCGKDKAIKLFKELDVVSGIGLIERKKQGQGKPTRIYVKNFIIPETTNPPAPSEPSAAPDPPPEPEPPTTPEPSPCSRASWMGALRMPERNQQHHPRSQRRRRRRRTMTTMNMPSRKLNVHISHLSCVIPQPQHLFFHFYQTCLILPNQHSLVLDRITHLRCVAVVVPPWREV